MSDDEEILSTTPSWVHVKAARKCIAVLEETGDKAGAEKARGGLEIALGMCRAELNQRKKGLEAGGSGSDGLAGKGPLTPRLPLVRYPDAERGILAEYLNPTTGERTAIADVDPRPVTLPWGGDEPTAPGRPVEPSIEPIEIELDDDDDDEGVTPVDRPPPKLPTNAGKPKGASGAKKLPSQRGKK